MSVSAPDWRERHDEYRQLGFTVLRNVIPPTLLQCLRHETDIAREVIRAKYGPQVQRLQPVYDYEELDHTVFDDFHRLPLLIEYRRRVLGEGFEPGGFMGVFFEPKLTPWCTAWHRDWFDTPTVDVEQFYEVAMTRLEMFSQLNVALYRDAALWIVPGSHKRRDTPAEEPFAGIRPALPPKLEGRTTTELEAECMDSVYSMPGGRPIVLQAGDVGVYRNCGWHMGCYVPYTKRATLHDAFFGPGDVAWWGEHGWRDRWIRPR